VQSDLLRPPSAVSRLQALQAASTIASYSACSRCDRRRSLRKSHTRSTGLSSGVPPANQRLEGITNRALTESRNGHTSRDFQPAVSRASTTGPEASLAVEHGRATTGTRSIVSITRATFPTLRAERNRSSCPIWADARSASSRNFFPHSHLGLGNRGCSGLRYQSHYKRPAFRLLDRARQDQRRLRKPG
jgi:hypothetical protein